MRVRFYAVGREIAGRNEHESNADTLDALRADLVANFGNRMGQLFDASSVLHNGQRLAPGTNTAFTADAVVDLLPPFAGG